MKPKIHSRLTRLPLGAIKPSGWLGEQLRRNADGMGGHLDELEPKMIGTPYTTRETFEGWGTERAAGWGAEISGNYWRGLIELAFTLGDRELMEKAEKWVKAVLRNRRDDGYLGTYREGNDFFDDYNAWGNSCGMNALLDYYDATGDKEVLDAVHGCMLWFCDNWKGDRKTRYVGITITECMMRCYAETGDERLIDFCRDYYEFLARPENDLFDKSIGSMLSPELHYNSNHGSALGDHLDNPAMLYSCTGDEKLLAASENTWKKAKSKVVGPHGGITCESEYLAPLGPIVESEYCSFTFAAKSLENLGMITGNGVYFDDLEKLVFNAAEGARKKDERAIAYLSSPNQIRAAIDSSYAANTHQVYAPCVPVACCPVTSVRILPEFTRNIAFLDGERLYLASFAPCSINTGGPRLDIDTDYPFDETVIIRASGEGAVKLVFRIPEWCDSPSLLQNGEEIILRRDGSGNSPTEITISAGETLKLILPMKVSVTRLNDSDRSSLFPVTISRGPLVYSLGLPERWQGWAGLPATPLPDGWQWFNVEPEIPASGLDVYDDMGMRSRLISWNPALDEEISPDDIRVVRQKTEGYPWEHPPVKLELNGYKAPYSYPPYPTRTLEPYTENGYAYISAPMPLTLVPYGCTALRITCFPRARHADTLRFKEK